MSKKETDNSGCVYLLAGCFALMVLYAYIIGDLGKWMSELAIGWGVALAMLAVAFIITG